MDCFGEKNPKTLNKYICVKEIKKQKRIYYSYKFDYKFQMAHKACMMWGSISKAECDIF